MVSCVHSLALDESRIIRLINPPPSIFHHCQRSSMSGDDIDDTTSGNEIGILLTEHKVSVWILEIVERTQLMRNRCKDGPKNCQIPTNISSKSKWIFLQVALQVQGRSEQSAILPQSLKHGSLRTQIVRPWGQMHGLDSYVSSCEHVTWLCKTLRFSCFETLPGQKSETPVISSLFNQGALFPWRLHLAAALE